MANRRVARKGVDLVITNHLCHPVHQIYGPSSPDVFFEGNSAHRVGDHSGPHLIPSGDSCVNHNPAVITGADDVFINGKKAARENDIYAGCGYIVVTTKNVFSS